MYIMYAFTNLKIQQEDHTYVQYIYLYIRVYAYMLNLISIEPRLTFCEL